MSIGSASCGRDFQSRYRHHVRKCHTNCISLSSHKQPTSGFGTISELSKADLTEADGSVVSITRNVNKTRSSGNAYVFPDASYL